MLVLLAAEEPTTYREAATEMMWQEAMQKELEDIERNKTWTLTNLPSEHKPIGLKWVFKLKKNSEENVIKHKTKLVAKGYVQRQGVDFEEVFATMTRLDTVRLILALVAQHRWEVHHLDVKSAFLNGGLQEEVYVAQPEGFIIKAEEHKVYSLSKALYDLRQVLGAWNIRLEKSLKSLNFMKFSQEQAVYIRNDGVQTLIVDVYIDDLIVTDTSVEGVKEFKQQMMKEFEMTDLRLLTYYLGIEVDQRKDCITL